MDTARLNELVKMQKKTDSSKAVKKEFNDNWLQFIREKGPGEEAFRYLIEGSSFCGMEPFAEYLRSSEDMQKTVIEFLKSEAFKKNSAISLKCALNLLACLLRDAETEYATCAVIMREIPRLAYTKEKQLIKDLGKIFARQFFAVIYAKPALPSLDLYELNQKDRNHFELIVRNALEQYQSLPFDEKEHMGADLARAWIDHAVTTPAAPAAQTEKETPQPLYTAPVILPEKKEPEAEKPAAPEEQGGAGLYCLGVRNLKDAFVKIQDQILTLTSDNRRIISEKESLKAECLKRREEAEHLKAEIEEKAEMLFAVEKERELQQARIQWLEEELKKKETEISDRIQMSQIAQMDTERQSDQQLKRLGSELSTFYQDIMESENVPMSAELGEILRDQIKDVFSVLIKHGIRVDQ